MRRYVPYLILAAILIAAGCKSTKSSRQVGESEPSASAQTGESAEQGASEASAKARADSPAGEPVEPEVGEGLEAATFAGGCFWCMEPPFEELDGVKSVVSGYCGGEETDPTYEQVAGGETGHTETVRITYDPEVVGYEKLLEVYWRSMDPTDDGGQFADRGSQYRPVIFYHDAEQKELAEESKRWLAEQGPFDEPIVVPIEPAGTFWKAEPYHQDYHAKNPKRYKRYYRKSGRKGFLERVWGEEDGE